MPRSPPNYSSREGSERRHDSRGKRRDDSTNDYSRKNGSEPSDRYNERKTYSSSANRSREDRGYDRKYDERDRERERDRDRARYDNRREGERDRDHNRTGASSRRSASPRHSSRPDSARPRSGSRSASPPAVDKAKPNFALSGLLAAETNTVKALNGDSTVLKYNEPPEARKPVLGWRLYVFKGSEQVELLHIHRQSAYLIGRDRLVADIFIEHPSCSKQHAVIQYRYVQQKDEFGASKGVVKPFIIDLESTNKTFVNDEPIPVSRFYELQANDVIKFGQSTREYVLLHDEAT